MKEKRDAYKLSMSKCEVFVIGEFSKSDVKFIKKWLDRIESAQHNVQPTGGEAMQILEYTPDSETPNVEVIEPPTSG